MPFGSQQGCRTNIKGKLKNNKEKNYKGAIKSESCHFARSAGEALFF